MGLQKVVIAYRELLYSFLFWKPKQKWKWNVTNQIRECEKRFHSKYLTLANLIQYIDFPLTLYAGGLPSMRDLALDKA